MSRTLAVCLLLTFALPLASAGPAPALAFLADSESGPLADGALVHAWPVADEPKVRPILVELAGPSTVFVDVEEQPGTHLKGRVFVGIWPDAAIAKDARLRVSLYVGNDLVNESFVPVTVDPNNVPDPTALLPPDPTDPQGAVFHIVAQVVPLVLQPPTMVDLGVVDVEVPEGSSVRLGFGLVGADGLPPTGAAMALKYDGKLSPSFVYLPWWSADPQAVSPQIDDVPKQQPPVTPPSTDTPTSGPAPAGSPGEESPAVGIVALLGVVAMALLWRRR